MALIRYKKGFTLIELIVTMAVLAIVAALAFPSFSRMIQDNQATTEANTLIAALQLARSEAVRRGMPISVSANSNDFDNGWCVHSGAACTDGSGGTPDTVIRQFSAASANISAAIGRVTFSARGDRTVPAIASGPANISVEPSGCTSGETDRRRVVTVGLSGRADVARGDCL